MVTRSTSKDPYNLSKTRTEENTTMTAYNCGGYALGLFSWYCPYPNMDKHDKYLMRYHDSRNAISKKTFRCVSQMVQEIPGLRVITKVSDLTYGEYAIAFRLSSDGDFHFIKRNSQGQWSHKRGARCVIEYMTKQEVFCSRWCDRYDGPIVLLAKKGGS